MAEVLGMKDRGVPGVWESLAARGMYQGPTVLRAGPMGPLGSVRKAASTNLFWTLEKILLSYYPGDMRAGGGCSSEMSSGCLL